MSFLGGGGGGGQAPKPPLPIQLNQQKTENEMIAADQNAYTQADQYISQYYPQLATGRDAMINQAYSQLTGPLDPTLQNTFVNNANINAIGAFGGGDQGFGLSKGSLARDSAEASVAQQEQGYQDYNRQFMSQLNNMFAPRSFGMTPTDAANLLTFNNNQYNNYLQSKYASQTAQANANAASGAQQQAGFVSSIGQAIQIAALAGAFSDRRLKTDIVRVGSLSNGAGIYRFRYKGMIPEFLGFMADEIEQVDPSHVTTVGGYKMVSEKYAPMHIGGLN